MHVYIVFLLDMVMTIRQYQFDYLVHGFYRMVIQGYHVLAL